MNVTLDISPKTEAILDREAAIYQKPVGAWTMERFWDFFAKFRESSPGAAEMDKNTFRAFDKHVEGTAQQEVIQQVAASTGGAATAQEASASPRTGAEALAFWRKNHLLGTFADREEDSPELARKLREKAQTRDWGES